MLKKLRWYAARLRVMNVREVAARLQAALRQLRLLAFYKLRGPRRARDDTRHYAFAAAAAPVFATAIPFHPLDFFAGREHAGLAASRLTFGAYDWHLEPKTGRHWPRQFFGLIDYRENNPVGDVRITWEYSRLQMLVTAALHHRAADTTERARLAQYIVDTFAAWDSENPPLCGVNYVSAMECSLRIISLCTSFDLVRADLPATAWQRLAGLVAQHAELVYHRLSSHSSAGNHTVSEAAGLVFAGQLFREHPAASRWSERGLAALERELPRQILDDGGGIEQASGYLKLVAEVGLLTQTLLQSQQRTFSARTLQKLHAAQRFLAALHFSATDLFLYGDADDSYALSPYMAFIGPAMTDRDPDWQLRQFPQAGLTCMQWRPTGAPDRRIQWLFHHHNLGMPPLFAHGHAGALALQVAVDGREILLDSGTFGYNSGGSWRNHLRGTRAHNTVALFGEDQSTQLSNFQWSHDVNVRLLEPGREIGGDILCMLAVHDGYRRHGVLHYRALLVHRRGEMLVGDHLIRDPDRIGRLFGAAPAPADSTAAQPLAAELNWHVAEASRDDDGGFRCGPADLDMRLSFAGSAGPDVYVYYESHSPLAGWRSLHYGELEGSHTLTRMLKGESSLSIATRIEWGASTDPDRTRRSDPLQSAWWQHPLDELIKSI